MATAGTPRSDAAPLQPGDPLVALLAGPDARVLGLSIRDRNTRVAARARVPIADADDLARYGDRPAVLVPPLTIIDLPLIREAARAYRSGENRCVRLQPDLRHEERSNPVAGHSPQVVAGPARALAHYVAHPADIDALPTQPIPPDGVMDGSTAAARRRAAWLILRRTAKPTDGWISRHFNRPISRVFSYAFLSLRLKADHASLITLLVGVAAAVIAAFPGYLAILGTGVLFHFASVLDGVDGEMARATFTESESGARLDAIVDQLTYLVCFIGMTVGWGRERGGTEVLWWGALIAAALVLSLLRGARFVSRHAPNASFVFIDRSVRRAAKESGHKALHLAAAAFTLLRRDLFAVIFLAVSLTGRRELIPALVAAGIVLANVTLSWYHRELAAAALLENPRPN